MRNMNGTTKVHGVPGLTWHQHMTACRKAGRNSGGLGFIDNAIYQFIKYVNPSCTFGVTPKILG